MSEAPIVNAVQDAEPAIDQPFSTNELQQFDSDDASAGSAIGKMLSLFFLYTVIAMAAVSAFTWYCIQSAKS